jgi:hypothetical protein
VVTAPLACFADGEALGVISDVALASLAGATANNSSATAATPRLRTRPRLECAIPVMVDISRTQAGTRSSPIDGPRPPREFSIAPKDQR